MAHVLFPNQACPRRVPMQHLKDTWQVQSAPAAEETWPMAQSKVSGTNETS